ncbi:uncharacterized protein [Linepithema humile]|uniref:uncharacterized protein n=1 Tax=Linepithema humile TaxID=83485 RepID=UPI00351EFDAD
MTITLPEKKKESILTLLYKFQNKTVCKIKDFAQLIGTLVAICPSVEYGTLYCKSLERAKIEALQAKQMNFDNKMKIPSFVRKDLNWWKKAIPLARRQIRKLTFDIEIFSDACLTGWGAFCNGTGAHGNWSIKEQSLDINHLELRAALLALKSFAGDLTNQQILLRVDNTTALAYINRMGSVKSTTLHELATEFWKWCEDRDLWVVAAYIASKENKEADILSRQINEDTEWTLADYAFKQITKVFGFPEIDLFASRINTKCKKFCAWDRDPEAVVSDAFTINWENLKFYAFPPFSIIGKVLQKIRNNKASGIVVVPLWNSQTWFPLFQKMSQGDWLCFEPNQYLLSSSFRNLPHPLARKLTLVAAKLSAKRF